MAHSLNNGKAADFMKRTSSFSTRGSRRGFVDDGIYITDVDDKNRIALSHQLDLLQDQRKEAKDRGNRTQITEINSRIKLVQSELRELPKKKPPLSFEQACCDVLYQLYPEASKVVRLEAKALMARLEAQKTSS